MANLACSGASISCSFGSASSTFTVLPTNMVNSDSMPSATINDYIPLVNILSFGECSSTTNPTVSSVIASSSGATTTAPCVPCTVTPWTPGITDVFINNMNALDDGSTCKCLWLGSISFDNAGEEDVDIS